MTEARFSKGNVEIWLPADIKHVVHRKLRRVTVRRRNHPPHTLPCRMTLPRHETSSAAVLVNDLTGGS